MELIDRNSLMKNKVWNCGGIPSDPYYNGYTDALDRIQEVLELTPTVDAITRDVHNEVCAQFMWERDMAMQQLEEHGIPFCGIAPDVVKVVRCKDCKHYSEGVCWYYAEDMLEHEYCSYGERKDDVRSAD